MDSKVCKKCNIKKSIDNFNFRKDNNTHRSECKSCKSEYNKIHRDKNIETAKKYRKGYYVKKQEELKIYGKEYYSQNRKEVRIKAKSYYKKNKDKIIQSHKEYIKKRLKTDPLFRLLNNMRSLIRQSIKRKKYIKTERTVKVLGCSIPEFKLHIEKQFESWMNWENHGRYDINRKTWQLDHIIAVSLAKSEEELIGLNHYTNFQPLESRENILKSNKKI